MKLIPLIAVLFVVASKPCLEGAAPGDRDAKVRNDRTHVLSLDRWIYNDAAKGFAEAKKSGKPLLVVVRCIPCTACAGFDERIVNGDKHVQDLMDMFVCVRLIQGNGLDLSLFQFDYDLSFAAFFMNGDKTIYGRFGSRSDLKETEKDISIEGFRKALLAALDMHNKYPSNTKLIAGKQPHPVAVKIPQDYPSLNGKYGPTLDYQGKVAQSCIHCHQIRDAERLEARRSPNGISDKLLFPWPMPDVIGISLDPQELATIKEVIPGSPAARAGFKSADKILSLEKQRPLSIADVQWVLHHAPDSGSISAVVDRGGTQKTLTVQLPKGWRKQSDISWRVGSWELRRMFTGGLLLRELTESERANLKVKEDQLALKVEHAGEYGEHAAAKRAGIKKGDVLVAIEGQKERVTEGKLFSRLVNKPIGEKVAFSVLRNGEEMTFMVPMQ